MNLHNHRFGKTKQMFDQMEAAYAENPDIVIIGPTSPYNKYNPLPYDAFQIRHPSWYCNDDPFYIPIEIAFKYPELYQRLLDQKREAQKAWSGVFNSILKDRDKIVGKAIFTSILDIDPPSNDPIWNSWMEAADGAGSLLKRFFIPAHNSKVDEWGKTKLDDEDSSILPG